MGVGKSTWDHKRNVLLDNFSLYYEYEVVYEGRSTNYHIIRKLGDYQKPSAKRNKTARDAIYEKEIVGVIQQDRLQTAKNVSRIIKSAEPIKAYHHADGTVYEYTRVRMRSMFGNTIGEGGTHGEILEKIWCRVDLTNNTYIPMSEEEICEFFKIFGAVKDEGKPAELDLLNDYQIGLISQKELNSAIGAIGLSNYLDAREKFHNKYDYYPIKVPRYGLDGIDTIRFLKGEPK